PLAPYEYARSDRFDVFAPLPAGASQLAERLGYDLEALLEAPRRLARRLRALDENKVATAATGGLLGALDLIGYDGGIVDWLRFRMDVLSTFVRRVSEHLKGLRPPRLIGMGPRTPSFVPLAGYDLPRLATMLDVVLPKFYF